MDRKKRAKLIGEILDELFPDPPIPLKHSDPYTLLIAVLLSAQCTDEKVNGVTPLLFRLGGTPQKMVKLGLRKIEDIIRPLGLAAKKAGYLYRLSKILEEKYGGAIPANFKELESLPGVGHKTASVVMAQAFHEDAFPVDTHILRSAKRWGLSSGKSVLIVEKDLKGLFPKKSWGKLHLQIILFARKYCPAKGHRPKECPVCSRLAAASSS